MKDMEKIGLNDDNERASSVETLDHTDRKINSVSLLPGNYELRASIVENKYGGEEIKIIIEKIGNPSENINIASLVKNLMGNSTCFRPGSRFRSDPELNGVEIDMEKLRDPKQLFCILHELGHVVDLRKKMENKENTDAYTFQLRPKYEDAKYWEKRLPAERNAWAEAIKIAKKLKKDHSINLFKLFKNSEEFMGWMRVNALRSYENHLEDIGIKAYSKETLVRNFKIKEAEEEAELAKKEWEALSEDDKEEVERINSLI